MEIHPIDMFQTIYDTVFEQDTPIIPEGFGFFENGRASNLEQVTDYLNQIVIIRQSFEVR
jgi:hypothetical protein